VTTPDERAPVRGCDGCAAEPDLPGITNRPGQDALQYRAGTWSTFVAEMLAKLPRQPVAGAGMPLARLNTRATDDPAVALVDAWSVAADVLTFYQERIANEGYLRTAIERRSVLELARAIGYELSPGVAAATWLSFTLEDPPNQKVNAGPGSTPPPRTAQIPIGTQVQSVPGPGQLPQTFETVQDLVARVEWNMLLPRSSQSPAFSLGEGQLLLTANGQTVQANQLYLLGTSSGLKANDVILAWDGAHSLPVHVLSVEVRDKVDTPFTIVHVADGALASVPALPPPAFPPPQTTGAIELAPLALNQKNVKAKVFDKIWDEQSLAAFCAIQRWDPAEVVKIVAALLAAQDSQSKVYAFRQRLACFGNNAPPYAQVHLQAVPQASVVKARLDHFSPSTVASFRAEEQPMANDIASALTTVPGAGNSEDWDAHPRTIWQDSRGISWAANRDFDVFLERAVQQVAAGSWVMLERGSMRQAFPITATGEETLPEFSITGRSTGLKLNLPGQSESGNFLVRRTSVYVQSELLPFTPMPVNDPIGPAAPAGAQAIQLDRMVVGLAEGQPLMLTGTVLGDDDQPTGLTRSEMVILSAVVHQAGFTTLYFAKSLANRYVRASVSLCANVARATHGQTVGNVATGFEILGSGDGSAANQVFKLQRPPLTWTSAKTSTGRESTLTIRVNDTVWDEVPSLYGLGPAERKYALRIADDGTPSITFGDGVFGARLPTGTGNVVATYRTGIGLAGQVPQGALSILMSKPLGVKGVTNALPADGAADPELLDDARQNAPVTVLTLGRIVSLPDYEDFARAFAGIGKAQAVPLWDAQTQLVNLTVAAADGTPVAESSDLYASLTGAIAACADGVERVLVGTFQQRYFRVAAAVTIDPAADEDAVLTSVGDALQSEFSFARRGFGQRVTSAEVMAAVQGVTGVVACNLTTLLELDDQGADQGSGVQSIITAGTAHWDAGAVVPAELLLLHPTGLTLTTAEAP
jgi:predicted phage baseplate assembly protein